MKIFVAHLDLGIVARPERKRRIDSIAFEVAIVAERVAGFVERVEPRRHVLVDALADVDCGPPVEPRAGLHRYLAYRLPVGFLQGAVQQAAASAAAEDQRARTFEHLDALRVVEIAEELHIVAKAVDEEVRARVDAADDELVAVAFALMRNDARHVAHGVVDALEALVLDEVLGQHADRLRNVDQRRVGLGRDRGAVGIDADRAGARVLGIGFAGWSRRSGLRRLTRRVSPRRTGGRRVGAAALFSLLAARLAVGLVDLDRGELRCARRRRLSIGPHREASDKRNIAYRQQCDGREAPMMATRFLCDGPVDSHAN